MEEAAFPLSPFALAWLAHPFLHCHWSPLLWDSSIYQWPAETLSPVDWATTEFLDFPFTAWEDKTRHWTTMWAGPMGCPWFRAVRSKRALSNSSQVSKSIIHFLWRAVSINSSWWDLIPYEFIYGVLVCDINSKSLQPLNGQHTNCYSGTIRLHYKDMTIQVGV